MGDVEGTVTYRCHFLVLPPVQGSRLISTQVPPGHLPLQGCTRAERPLWKVPTLVLHLWARLPQTAGGLHCAISHNWQGTGGGCYRPSNPAASELAHHVLRWTCWRKSWPSPAVGDVSSYCDKQSPSGRICGEGEQDDWTAAYFKPVITGSVSQEKLTRLYILLFSSTNTKKPNFPFGFGDLVKSVADLERHRVIKSFPS